MGKINLIIGIFYLLLIIVVYKSWFLTGTITGGDLWYFFPSMYDNHKLIPSASVFFAGNGFGGSAIPYMAINFFLSIPFFFGKVFGLSWDVLVRVFILFPFLIIGSISPFLLFKKLTGSVVFSVISAMIYLLNTYILMLVSGGLVVIGIGYALIPLIFLLVVKIYETEKLSFKNMLLLGFTAGVQSIMDVRVTYMTFIGVLVYVSVRFIIDKNLKSMFQKVISCLLVPGIIAIVMNSFWVFPALMYGSNPLDELGGNYTSIDSVRFFSFAKFEDTISLLHPNWPENIFGKVYFLRPEFLLFGIFAFASLIFVKKKNIRVISPFIFIALLGIFLAKGSNEPFGFVYLFLFENIPGFVFYRDPTKWYMLTALSYSILIPFSLYHISSKLGRFGYLVLILFSIYFLLTIQPALVGRLPGTLQNSEIPQEYIKFEKFMVQQKPGRVLWIPAPSRFSYFSEKHPAISGNRYFDISDPSEMAEELNERVIEDLIARKVYYIAAPYDNRGELFLKDRKYDAKEYEETADALFTNEKLEILFTSGELKIYTLKPINK